MNLSTLSNEELTLRLDKLAQSERKITHLILAHINEMESRRLYAELGFDSMFRYLTRHLKYSDDAAYRRLSAARLLKKSPAIADKIENGNLTLTQLTQVQSALKQELKSNPESEMDLARTLPAILEKIENKTSFETKASLAKDFNLPIATQDIVSPQRNETVRMEITLTIEQLKTLETARDLISHTVTDGNWADVLTVLAVKQIQRILGKDKLENVSEKYAPSTQEFKRKSTPSFMVARNRSHISIKSKRSLLLHADYCCEYRSADGTKCKSKYQLQIDHRQPIALGGRNDLQNLRVLCRAHNLAEAEKLGLNTR
ncbi:HNH endonuclease [Bdellovibrio sp. HCB288]|uniref:HNH endonuclease n=1 Tax=Bdellovibrio sp. HCB288 TaxID=3394355 RepID=UPI0039B4884A